MSCATAEANLSRLIVRGAIRDSGLERIIDRLRHRFREYVAGYPYGLWAPGLALTNEMRAITELYLPMEDISRAFHRFFSLSLRYSHYSGSNPLPAAASWLDALHQLREPPDSANPAQLLEKLASDDNSRIRFLFSCFLPQRHGGRFSRYPGQSRFLENRLARCNPAGRGLRCLDAACGTGEGTYDLARLLRKYGLPVGDYRIDGCSIEPLEVFAAAHCCFPHDRERERLFRAEIESFFTDVGTDGISFFKDDITRSPCRGEEPYDIILCNGLLGGPLFHREEAMTKAVSALAARLKPGGVLLAADRFHEGWKRKVPRGLLEGLMKRNGLDPLMIEDGIASQKP